MTSQQKLIVIVLAVANILLFCCGLPVAAFLLLSGSGLTTAVIPPPTPVRTSPTAPPTIIPTSTIPQPTATRVIPLPATPALTPPESGWTMYPVPQDGFALAIPSSWAAQNFDPSTLASLMQKVQEKNPQYAKTLGSQAPQMAAAGIKFIAIDLVPQPEAPNFATNLNVLRHTLPQALTMDSYVNTNLKQLQDSGVAKSIARRRIKLTAAEAEEIRYTAAMTLGGSEKTTMAITQYLILRNLEGYVLTFTTDPKLDARYFPTFEKIAKSLQWTR